MFNINFLLSIIFMAVTGFIDGQAFNRVPQLWQADGITRVYLILIVMLLINLGMMMYFISTYFMHLNGVSNSLIITLIYFISSIISLSFMSGNFLQLPLTDKVITFVSMLMVGLLYYRGLG